MLLTGFSLIRTVPPVAVACRSIVVSELAATVSGNDALAVPIPTFPVTPRVLGNVYAPAPNVPAVTRDAGTAPEASVPMLVSEEKTTVLFNVVPVRVPAAAVTVMLALPSKLTPLMVRAVANLVAVSALPVSAPANVVAVTVVNPPNVPVIVLLPVTLIPPDDTVTVVKIGRAHV